MWEWKERTKTFLLHIQFIPSLTEHYPNYRWTDPIRKGKETMSFRINDGPEWEVPLMDWAPSWLEFGRIGELMRFTDYLNSLKSGEKLKFRELLGNEWINAKEVKEKNWWQAYSQTYSNYKK